MLKNLMARYNYAFGYVSSFFFFIGTIFGPIGIIWGIIDVITRHSTERILDSLIFGLILFLVAVIIFLFTRKKCPEEKKGIVGLMLSMVIVGIYASLMLVWFFAKWFFKLVFHISGSSSSGMASNTTKFANGYERDIDGQWCSLYSTNMGYAYLMDGSGNMIGVRPYGSDGLVIDDAGNLYRPS